MRTAKIENSRLQEFLNYLSDNSYEIFKIEPTKNDRGYTDNYYMIEFDKPQSTVEKVIVD